jgi:UDP-N-acetylmuramoyl-L-alanyl-D-glutamate--2,6-diaminopimelate ligase
MRLISLSLLLEGIIDVTVSSNVMVNGLSLDSRGIKPGNLFFAYQGVAHDGRKFINQAVEQGATAILVDQDESQLDTSFFVSRSNNHSNLLTPIIIPVRELREKVGLIASRFYDYPSSKTTIIGITGTNGKTSICHLLAQSLQLLQQKVAIIGTLGNGVLGQLKDSANTTPDALVLQQTLAEFVEQGMQYVVMEVSSHALDQGRVVGVEFDYVVFTNLTRDHLDYHHTLEEYAAVKKKLLDFPELKAAVINIDDAYGAKWAEEYREKLPVYTYSIEGCEPAVCRDAIHRVSTNDRGYKLLGQFNRSNLLAVTNVLQLLGFSSDKIHNLIPKLEPIKGRMQTLGGGEQPRVVIDYSHTPDSLKQALCALRPHCQGRLICVFGCGGDRDRGKRPQMASIAEQYADQVIVTDDNPRYENSALIIQEILTGFEHPEKVKIESDRKKAIALAISQAQRHDIILLAGKGHETYQEIQGKRLPFDECMILKELLRV